MTFFEQSVFFGVSVSLAAYGIGVLLQKKFKFALFNPLLISVVLTIAVLRGREVFELPAHARDRVPRRAAL